MVFDSDWTWDDLYALDTPLDQMALTVTHKVCYIVDMTRPRHFPTGISPQKVRSVLRFNNDNTDMVVIVGSNLFIEMMANSIVSALGDNREAFRFAASVEEARRIIGAHQKANTPAS